MKRSKILAGALALLPAAGLLAVTQLADAHHPEIAATTVCIDTTAKVTMEVSSWVETNEPPRRVNRDITVSWDGKIVGRGEFTPENKYRFTLVLTVPADDATHVATATAAAPFGPSGEYGFQGAFRTVDVKVPGSCLPPATTTSTTTSTSSTTTSTTTTTTAPQTQAQVLGETVTRPDVAVAVEVLPRFAG